MLISAHALTGAFIGKEVGYPPLAFLLGVVSHLLLDSIPHADGPDDGKPEGHAISFWQYAVVAVDMAVGLIVFIYLNGKGELSAAAIWGAIGGIFPDFVDNVPFWSKQVRKINVFGRFHAFHSAIQKIKLPMYIGLLGQYIIVAVFLWLILR